MRIILPVAFLAALAGCSSPDELALEHRSELDARTRGIMLDDDGDEGNAGMWGTTCAVDTQWGSTGADYDYETEDEDVQDGTDDPNIGIVSLVVTPNMVNITTPHQWPEQHEFAVQGVIQSRLIEGGFVALGGSGNNCDVSWHDVGGGVTASVSLSESGCLDGSLTVDPEAATVFISTDRGLAIVSSDGDVTLTNAPENALVAWDSTVDALYLAVEGDTLVEAYEADGQLRWGTAVEGTITALSDMGAQGAAAVSTETSKAGEFIVLDGITGEVRADIPTPSAATSMTVSGNGAVLAVVLPQTVHFFDVLTLE